MPATKKVLLVLTHGNVPCEALVPTEMLRRVGAHVTVASVQTETTIVNCSMGINIVADTKFEDLTEDDFDAVILPGGLDASKTMAANKDMQNLFRKYHAAGKLIALICAGPTLLAAAGIAPGSRITSYPTVKSTFSDYEYVEENVPCSWHVFPFAMAILEYLLGKEATDKLRASSLIY
ncbi:class I glutamine amidotransferase-like protein [Syncephalis fuscata]|nr:class I glutamine amidotransferase-like protein [Syncephalis fuscata]